MIKKISDSELNSFGISTNHEIMDNGELRFRLNSADGTAYVRTVASGKGGWQNSHYHHKTKELYIVQKGWIAMAEYIDMKMNIKVYYPYEVVITQPGIVHNVYLSSNSVIHSIRFGECEENDRIPYDEFNELTKTLSEEDIKKIANKYKD